MLIERNRTEKKRQEQIDGTWKEGTLARVLVCLLASVVPAIPFLLALAINGRAFP